MAGHHPPPAPAPAPPHHLPAHGGQPRYHYQPPRRPQRRTAGGLVVGLLGVVAALGVLAILGASIISSLIEGTPGRPGQPGARSGQQVTRATATDNALYKTGPLTPVQCKLPRLQQGTASMGGFMDALAQCLDASWTRQFAKADVEYTPPKRVFWSAPGRSPCGTYPSPGASAFYCPANNTMYVGLQHIIETSGGESLDHFGVFARVVAHEYGHHVQDRAGILLYGHQVMEQSDTAGRNAASRRIELQAQCFAGAFLGAERLTIGMTRRQYAAMIVDVQGRGDERQPVDRRDHGSGHNYAGWVTKGFRGQGLGVCNTWTAPASAIN
ncbi:neutral zinc metallopeptidase [Spirillospora sp. NPDC047279]|uniref:neutral zinc metallopeptidase n=1 Tax=Spirillospora sp. NPDC047279 TaxID=3155478 RepID=UPI0033F28766